MVFNQQNLNVMINMEHQKKTLFSYFSINIQKSFGWEYDLGKWEEEKKLMPHLHHGMCSARNSFSVHT